MTDDKKPKELRKSSLLFASALNLLPTEGGKAVLLTASFYRLRRQVRVATFAHRVQDAMAMLIAIPLGTVWGGMLLSDMTLGEALAWTYQMPHVTLWVLVTTWLSTCPGIAKPLAYAGGFVAFVFIGSYLFGSGPLGAWVFHSLTAVYFLIRWLRARKHRKIAAGPNNNQKEV